MAGGEKLATAVSTKRQVILHRKIRRRRGRAAGPRLIMEETANAVRLKPMPAFAGTRPDEVSGLLPTAESRRRSPRWMRRCLPRPGAGMLAIDTNVIVRHLTTDHPAQSLRARTLIDGQAVLVPVIVVLATERVLRGACR